MCLAYNRCKVALHHQDVFALKGAAWHPLNMHKPIVTTPSRRSSTIARYTVLGSLVFCTHFALVVIISIVLTRFWLICPLLMMKSGAIAYKLFNVQCSMFMAEWTGPHPTHGAGKASELRLLVSFVKQRLHSSSLLKGNG